MIEIENCRLKQDYGEDTDRQTIYLGIRVEIVSNDIVQNDKNGLMVRLILTL